MKRNLSKTDIYRERLKIFVDKIDLSQQKIAKILNYSYQKLNKIYTNQQKNIDIELIGLLTKEYDLNPIWFFTGVGSQKLNEVEIIDKRKKIELEERVSKLEIQLAEIKANLSGSNQ